MSHKEKYCYWFLHDSFVIDNEFSVKISDKLLWSVFDSW